jgi:hypothetical protein
MQENLPVLNGQIPHGAFVTAVDTASGSATHRATSGTCYSFTNENETARFPAEGEKAETAKMWKESMQRQRNALSEKMCEEMITLSFYHIRNLHQTGRRTTIAVNRKKSVAQICGRRPGEGGEKRRWEVESLSMWKIHVSKGSLGHIQLHLPSVE